MHSKCQSDNAVIANLLAILLCTLQGTLQGLYVLLQGCEVQPLLGPGCLSLLLLFCLLLNPTLRCTQLLFQLCSI